MKTYLLSYILLMLSLNGYTQKICVEKTVPIIVDTIGPKRLPIYAYFYTEVYDIEIRDTMFIEYVVLLSFKHPLRDTLQPVILKKGELFYITIRDNNKMRRTLWADDEKSVEDQYIWNLSSEYILYWFRFQPYDKMVLRDQFGDFISLQGTFVLIPASENTPKCGYKRIKTL